MVTTIEVSDRTYRLLKLLSEERGESLDETIMVLYCEVQGIPRDAFDKHR